MAPVPSFYRKSYHSVAAFTPYFMGVLRFFWLSAFVHEGIKYL